MSRCWTSVQARLHDPLQSTNHTVQSLKPPILGVRTILLGSLFPFIIIRPQLYKIRSTPKRRLREALCPPACADITGWLTQYLFIFPFPCLPEKAKHLFSSASWPGTQFWETKGAPTEGGSSTALYRLASWPVYVTSVP